MFILTEKPSVAKAFAAALSVPEKNRFWENNDFLIVNAVGHLLENFDPEDYDPRFKVWRTEDLPIIPERFLYKPVQQTAAQLALIKRCFDSRPGDELLLATDAEREGEVIGAEILDYIGFSNLSLARRFWVSEALTPEVVRSGVKNAKPLAEYSRYKNQGFARQKADWLIGMNLSRLLSLASNKPLAAGRVQSAVLAAVYERESHIASFAKQKYVELSAILQGPRGPCPVTLLNPANPGFPSRFQEDDPLPAAALEKIKTSDGVSVSALGKEKKSTPPPRLFNLTALQKQAHIRFSYSPEDTLAAAQALYEKYKCLSYPRTPSSVMGDNNVDLVKSVFDTLSAAYPDHAAAADPLAVSPEYKRVFNSAELQDHHALIPLAPLPDAASPVERDVFFLVLDRFFSAFMPPYDYYAVNLSCSIQGFDFFGRGVEVIEPGWTRGAQDNNADSADDGADDADDAGRDPTARYDGIEEGKSYPLLSLSKVEKWTGPKKHFTFASILSLMENPRGADGGHLAGLGTPATRAAILQKLSGRKYIEIKGKSILISPQGKFLVESLLKNDALTKFISIPETTRWEEALNADPDQFVKDIESFVRGAVKNSSFDLWQNDPDALGKCPLCGKNILEGKLSFYCPGYKSEPPCKFAIWKEKSGASFSAADAKLLLLGQKTKPKKCKNKDGKPFEAAFFLQGQSVKPVFSG